MTWFLLEMRNQDGSTRASGRVPIPEFFETWTWEGDASVLPAKWDEALLDCCDGGVVPHCARRPWEAPHFDAEGIFFLTQRSETCGIGVALAASSAGALGMAAQLQASCEDEDEIGVIACLGVSPASRRRGLGRALLRLCLRRHAQLGRKRVYCVVDAESRPDVCHLLRAENFQPQPA